DIVEVDHYNPFHYELVEDVIHHGLESSRTVGEAKEHNQGSESRFPFIPFLHSDIVKTPLDVQLSEVFSAPELGNQFRNEGKWVLVFDGDCIESSIVLNKPKTSVFLFDKENRRCHQRFGRSDASRV
ncbi:hypothetical protein BYT27DRAFT_7090891, partial [Phlegmacium glaucopus]